MQLNREKASSYEVGLFEGRGLYFSIASVFKGVLYGPVVDVTYPVLTFSIRGPNKPTQITHKSHQQKMRVGKMESFISLFAKLAPESTYDR